MLFSKSCFKFPSNILIGIWFVFRSFINNSTGSDHIREKDGIWAALAWLSVMDHTGKSVEDILKQHWATYGRNYFTRYDYEECSLDPCNEMMTTLEKTITDPAFIGKEYLSGGKTYKTKIGDNFSYVDPVDKSVSTKQVN